jgi:hypothetical protein
MNTQNTEEIKVEVKGNMPAGSAVSVNFNV